MEIIRYWIDEYHQIIRPWRKEEYESTSPNLILIERYWYNCCPSCGAYQIVRDNEEACKTNIRQCGQCSMQNKPRINLGYDYGFVSMTCMECGTRFSSAANAELPYCKKYGCSTKS